MNRFPGLIFLFIIIFLGNSNGLTGQKYEFRQFGIEEGICYSFIYTVNQDKNGYLWLGTGEGLCKFDGFNFTSDFTTDSLPPAFVKKTFRDQQGNLWFGHNDGSITKYDGARFTIINTLGKITSTINDIVQDSTGNILFATQNQGIIIVKKDLKVKFIVEPFRRKLLSSLCFTTQGKLLIGTNDGLHLYEFDAVNDTAWPVTKISQVFLYGVRFPLVFLPPMKKNNDFIHTPHFGFLIIQPDLKGINQVNHCRLWYRNPVGSIGVIQQCQDNPFSLKD